MLFSVYTRQDSSVRLFFSIKVYSDGTIAIERAYAKLSPSWTYFTISHERCSQKPDFTLREKSNSLKIQTAATILTIVFIHSPPPPHSSKAEICLTNFIMCMLWSPAKDKMFFPCNYLKVSQKYVSFTQKNSVMSSFFFKKSVFQKSVVLRNSNYRTIHCKERWFLYPIDVFHIITSPCRSFVSKITSVKCHFSEHIRIFRCSPATQLRCLKTVREALGWNK